MFPSRSFLVPSSTYLINTRLTVLLRWAFRDHRVVLCALVVGRPARSHPGPSALVQGHARFILARTSGQDGRTPFGPADGRKEVGHRPAGRVPRICFLVRPLDCPGLPCLLSSSFDGILTFILFLLDRSAGSASSWSRPRSASWRTGTGASEFCSAPWRAI